MNKRVFIYVMDEASKRLLEEHGYKLIKEDTRNGVWCFENKTHDMLDFTLDCPCVVSDVMTF